MLSQTGKLRLCRHDVSRSAVHGVVELLALIEELAQLTQCFGVDRQIELGCGGRGCVLVGAFHESLSVWRSPMLEEGIGSIAEMTRGSLDTVRAITRPYGHRSWKRVGLN
ncbi:hypothetical protein WL48_26610 [Burkholderia ubonensis]|nr:hypothetical protein WL48_26610 [Burkholderia ubonensis]KWC34930.1 hypothetical protein WL49_22370 [Burkholderia ubonensis]